MRALLAQLRRAPGRIVASVLALALATAAIGVLAIPTVSEGALHAAVDRDGLGDLVVATSPLAPGQVDALARLSNVAAVEGASVETVELGDDDRATLVRFAPKRQLNTLQLDEGREAAAADELVASPGVAAVGDQVAIAGRNYSIVGVGSTLWWSGSDVLYGTFGDGIPSTVDHLSVLAVDDGKDELDALSEALRRALAEQSATYTDFPITMPDGSTPIDADIRQVSALIGMLGVVAGLVAMVLLASTTATLIVERSREVAVMRALGGRRRQLRRRLRRIALGIAAAGLVIGLPLGVVLSNLIARMVLERFVGITPDVAIDWRVVAGSAVAILLAARLVAGRSARRVTSTPLADALRDRDGDPFGRRWFHRAVARLSVMGLPSRLATRATVRRPVRSLAIIAQIGAAVAAAFLVVSLTASVNAYNTASHDVWAWDERALAADPGLPLTVIGEAGEPAAGDAKAHEFGILVFGAIDDWEVEVNGVAPGSSALRPDIAGGRWLTPGARDAVVSAGFAERENVRVGETIEVELATGDHSYRVVGTMDDHSRSVYLDRDVLADDLGGPGRANVVYATGTTLDPTRLEVVVDLDTAAAAVAENGEGRDAISAIFGAIGVIVAGVAAISVISSMGINLFERRHELAALQALGARRRQVRRILARELVPLGVIGLLVGLPAGALGTRGIIASFEASNAVDIGVIDAYRAVPVIVLATLLGLVVMAALVARQAGRRPVAAVLRGAA